MWQIMLHGTLDHTLCERHWNIAKTRESKMRELKKKKLGRSDWNHSINYQPAKGNARKEYEQKRQIRK
ncbi:uncharacterized protein K489DRAFT_256670 [Dissoconium aciculare CBS 342.82]|uniref:Uncharacterized protein n=1 Tax=Dissoconium aciculare CBS 342.82 TaxID=1314786 RepID=A0A6J3M183_9PEZI|nr:uncharacterized protein K489DRAFT_256670 [Dissoconium aciculare CBS 342.82]KAF1821790.1 hypothetical protein K489DRAFT_256670 [Dissoconium aciculare CBS 342.82]